MPKTVNFLRPLSSEFDKNKQQVVNPSARVIENIMNYSKSLEIVKIGKNTIWLRLN